MDHIGRQIKKSEKYNKVSLIISAVFGSEVLEIVWYTRMKSLKSPSPLLSVFSSGLQGHEIKKHLEVPDENDLKLIIGKFLLFFSKFQI